MKHSWRTDLFKNAKCLVSVARTVSSIESTCILVLDRRLQYLIMVGQCLHQLYHGIVVLAVGNIHTVMYVCF